LCEHTRDEEETRLENLEADNATSTEASSEENEDGTRSDALANVEGTRLGLVGTDGRLGVNGGIESRLRNEGNGALLLLLTKLDGLGGGLLGGLGGDSLLVLDGETTRTSVHLGAGEGGNTDRGQVVVTRLSRLSGLRRHFCFFLYTQTNARK
jgi:hypothetical protein